jgi:hypothetical protein
LARGLPGRVLTASVSHLASLSIVSTGDPLGRPRVVRQSNLFGGTDVLSLYGRDGRIRTNLTHCASDFETATVVRQTRQLERAELVELPDAPLETHRCPRCGRTGLLDRDFGTRVLNGQRRRQSWCRRCRSRRRQ